MGAVNVYHVIMCPDIRGRGTFFYPYVFSPIREVYPMGLKDKMKKIGDKMDVTCDKCGKMMKPGGAFKKNVGGEDHQFCSQACGDAFQPGDKAK